MNLTIQHNRPVRAIARVFAAVAFIGVSSWSVAAVGPDQSRATAPVGDGWQILSASPVPAAPVTVTPTKSTGPVVATSPTPSVAPASMAVAPVVLPGSDAAPSGVLTFSITPQDINLRNALDRWLQTRGWQLAWKIDDDLPLEFNATFSGDFTSVLTQVMKATNHMRVPTRVCRHTNNVMRVIARAANCQD